MSFFSVVFVFAGKKQSKPVEKMSEIRKKSTWKWWLHFFEKFPQNPQTSKSRVSLSNLGLGIFDEVSVSKF